MISNRYEKTILFIDGFSFIVFKLEHGNPIKLRILILALNHLVDHPGLEPGTYRLWADHSNLLS